MLRQLRAIGFRRLEPLSGGRPRGTPIVRHYWERYLVQHRVDIRGRALEIGTTETIRRFGGSSLEAADAVDLTAHSRDVNVVADLARADGIPSETYDCFVNQFTMHVIYDVESALYHSIRILRPGGVLLVNFSCLDDYFPRGLDMRTGAPMFLHWWFTPIQVENLMRSIGLTEADYTLEVFGNLFARIAYQLNLAAEELTQHELGHLDPVYPLLICVRVVRPPNWRVSRPQPKTPWLPEVRAAAWSPVTGHHVR